MYAAIQRAVNCTLKSLSVRDNGTDNSTENGHIFIHFLISFAVHITDTASTVNREEASQTSVGGMRDLLMWICWLNAPLRAGSMVKHRPVYELLIAK